MKMKCLLLLLAFALRKCLAAFAEDIDSERKARAKLYDDLASHQALANKLRPLPKGGVTDVDLNVWLYKIGEVAESAQTVETCLYISMSWVDISMAWNLEDYGNISSAKIPSDMIWHPYIDVLNSADSSKSSLGQPLFLSLEFDGKILYEVNDYAKIHCTFDMTFFPFDSQTCKIIIRCDGVDAKTRLRNTTMVDLNTTFLSSVFPKDGEWKIRDIGNISSKDINFDFGFVELTFTMDRRPWFSLVCFILPMLVTSLLSFLVFWMPPDNGEKMSFLVSIYMSMALYISSFGSSFPKNWSSDKIPRILQLLLQIVLKEVLTMLVTAIVLYRHGKEQEIAKKKHRQEQEIAKNKHVSGSFVSEDTTDKKTFSSHFPSVTRQNISHIQECRKARDILNFLVGRMKMAGLRALPSQNKRKKPLNPGPIITAVTLDKIFFLVLLALYIVCFVFYFK